MAKHWKEHQLSEKERKGKKTAKFKDADKPKNKKKDKYEKSHS